MSNERSRILLFVFVAPITFTVLWLALSSPFKLIDIALAQTAIAGIGHKIGLVFGLGGALAIHIKMWRALKPSDARTTALPR